jgi:hypothetical protein
MAATDPTGDIVGDIQRPVQKMTDKERARFMDMLFRRRFGLSTSSVEKRAKKTEGSSELTER